MTEWREVSLDDVIEIFDSRRVPLSSTERAKRKGPYPYYGAQGIIDYLDDYLFDGRYVLVPEDGENLRSRKLPIAFFADGRFWVNNHAHIIRAKPGVATDRFVQSAIESLDIGPYVTGAAQPKLSQANLRQIPLKLPPLDVQRSISNILGALDDLIENNRRRIQVLEEMAKAIYREWFVRFRYPGHEADDLVDSPDGRVPSGWKVVPLDELVSLSRDTIDAREVPAGYPAVGLEHIPRRQVTLNDWGCAGNLQSRKTRFRADDVLFGKIRPYFHKVSVAPLDGICSTDAIVIRPREPYWGLVVMTVSSSEFVANATQTASGTKMPRADWKVIGQYPVPVPPDALAERFTDHVRMHLATAKNFMLTARRLAVIRELSLPKLVTGQIDVSNLDLDAVMGASA